MRRWSALVALALPAMSHGCSSSTCAEIGCGPSLQVVFVPALDPTRTYVVALASDDEAPTVCTFAQASSAPCRIVAIWTGNETTIGADGTPLPNGGLAAVWLPGRPTRVQVTVSAGDEVVAAGSFESVDYRNIELSGPGCGSCVAGTVKIVQP